jgi:hypothetical protein
MIVPIRIEFFHPDINEADLEKEAEDNISEKKYVYTNIYTPPTRGVGVGYNVESNEAEKKTGNGGNNRNIATGKRDAVYEAYLDQLVYDDDILLVHTDLLDEVCAEDIPFTEDTRSVEEVEEHFRRIEDRECGVALLPRTQNQSAPPGFAAAADNKISVGPWEV